MENKGLRVSVDGRNEKLGYRLREAQQGKIPMQLIVGDKEMEDGSVNLRRYGEKQQTTLSFEDFVELSLQEIKEKTIRHF